MYYSIAMDSDNSFSRDSSDQESCSENELIFDETTQTESEDKDGDSGVIFPYQFEPYADQEDEDDKERNRIPQDLDRLQNVEW